MSVLVERRGAATHVRLDRPEKRNALDGTTWRGLRDAVRDLADDADVGIAVLEAAGPVFSAGLDCREGPADGSHQARRLAAARWHRLLDDLEALPQVTIAAIRGAAIGGGLVLTIACDLRVATESTLFRLPEISLGVPPAWGSATRLVRTVGLSRARDLVLGGATMTAAEALASGLVQRVVADDGLEDAVAALVEHLSHVPVAVLSQTKQALAQAHLPGAAWADADRVIGTEALSGLPGRDLVSNARIFRTD